VPGTNERGALLQAWEMSLAGDLEDRIRVLSQAQRAAYSQARIHRSDGQLVPGSLTQEIADNTTALQQTLERYHHVVAHSRAH
jgi:hypothetical protein